MCVFRARPYDAKPVAFGPRCVRCTRRRYPKTCGKPQLVASAESDGILSLAYAEMTYRPRDRRRDIITRVRSRTDRCARARTGPTRLTVVRPTFFFPFKSKCSVRSVPPSNVIIYATPHEQRVCARVPACVKHGVRVRSGASARVRERTAMRRWENS